MPEIDRLNGGNGWTELEFIEREVTPEPLMRLGIQLHLGGLSLSNTFYILDTLGAERCRTTVHNWVQKADLQPVTGRSPDHVAVNETVIQLNNQRFCLYAAIDPATHDILHVRLFSTRTQALTERFLAELQEKHGVVDAVFLLDSAPRLHAALHRHRLRFQTETHGNRNSIELIFKEVKQRTNHLSITSTTPTQQPPKHGSRASHTGGTS